MTDLLIGSKQIYRQVHSIFIDRFANRFQVGSHVGSKQFHRQDYR